MQLGLERSSKPSCRQGRGVQHSRKLANVYTRDRPQLRLKDRVVGKAFSATGNFGPPAQPKRREPSNAASSASPRRDSDGPTPQGDKHAARELNARMGACRSLNELQQLVEPKLHQDVMDVFNINSVWGRLAKLSSKQGGEPSLPHSMNRFRDQLAGITLEKLQLLSTRAAANIMHSLGRLRLRPANGLLTQLLGQLTAGDGAMLQQATPQGLSNMAWTLSRLVPLQPDEQMALFRIAAVAVSRLRLQGATEAANFKPQEVSNLALAYAKAGLSAAAGAADAMLLKDLFDELATAALTKLPDFNMQEFSNIAWAFAKVGHPHQELMVGIMQAATPRLREFAPQELANLLWAVATLHCRPEPGFLPAWALAARQAVDCFNAQDVANSLWALAKLRFYDPLLNRALLLHTKTKLSTFNAQNLANSLVALASLQHRDEAAIAALASAAQGRLHEFNTQGLANMLWALAALDSSRNVTIVDRLLQQLAAQDASMLTLEGCTNVWQAWCWFGLVKGGQGRMQDHPEVLCLVDQCEQRAKADMAAFTTPSPAQLQVASMLRAVLADRAAGLEVAQKQQHPVTHQVVDIVLLRPGGAWAAALEVDGKSAYVVNKPGHLLGGTVLRDRLLQAQGLPVVTIPLKEWNRQKGKEAQKQYLHATLDALLAKPPGS